MCPNAPHGPGPRRIPVTTHPMTGARQMPEGSYDLVKTPEGWTARISARGAAVLAVPAINRGTAFTAEERHELGLTGLLPSGVSTLDGQLRRTYAQFSHQGGGQVGVPHQPAQPQRGVVLQA